MTVEYEQTKADVTRFLWHHLRTAPYIRRGLIAAVGLCTVLNGVVTLLRWPDRPLFALWTALTTPILFAVIGVVVGLPVSWMIVQFLLREGTNRGTIGRHRVTIDDQDVREETDHGTQIARWPAIHRVDQNPQYVYIYIQAGAAHVIPKRAFQTEGDAAAFFARAHHLWSSALSPGASA